MKIRNVFIVSALLVTCICCNKKTSPLGKCEENVRDDRACTAIYQPVCGCNNKTYGNSCEAEARGITKYTEGECKKVSTTLTE